MGNYKEGRKETEHAAANATSEAIKLLLIGKRIRIDNQDHPNLQFSARNN